MLIFEVPVVVADGVVVQSFLNVAASPGMSSSKMLNSC